MFRTRALPAISQAGYPRRQGGALEWELEVEHGPIVLLDLIGGTVTDCVCFNCVFHSFGESSG